MQRPNWKQPLGKSMLRSIAAVVLGVCLLLAVPAPTFAQDPSPQMKLRQVLTQTYSENPTLQSARAELRNVAEGIPQAKSGWRPNVAASANHQFQKTEFHGGGAGAIPGFNANQTTTNQTVGLTVTQPLFRGLRTVNSTSAAENTFYAQQASLRDTAQSVLLAAITVYMDVVRDQAVLELRTKNEDVIARHLEATRERFAVGEVTRTDVSQAESRLAGAIAERIDAEATLHSSHARFEEITGSKPGRLVKPEVAFRMPGTLDQALAMAAESNPVIHATRFAEAAAVDQVDTVRGELFPEVSLLGSMQRTYDPQFASADEQDTSTVLVSASIPLYQSGAVASRIRQAKSVSNQRQIQILEAMRTVRQQTISAWEVLQAAQAGIRARRAQVDAAQLALDGVEAENQVGARTLLDVLDAEQELLNSQVSLVSAERDELVASFSLAAALGRLTPEELGLSVPSYDADAYATKVRNAWYGFDATDPNGQ